MDTHYENIYNKQDIAILKLKYETVPNEDVWHLRFKAADVIEQKLREKRLLFQQRVFDYYQNKVK